jgi:hypothetical protein
MAIKFDKRIRLWKSSAEAENVGIGINFGSNSSKKERDDIFAFIEAALTLKYGKGEK